MVAHRHLPDGVLRSVASKNIVEFFGYHLRTGSAGGADTHALSRPTERIDYFLSHSWRDSGLLKYLALCWYFNSKLAVGSALTVGFLLAIYQRVFEVVLWPTCKFMNFPFTFAKGLGQVGIEFQIDPTSYWADPSHVLLNSNICQFFGMLTFVLVLLTGHLFRKSSGFFLDKICINQTDQKRKLAGIQAIDQFILRSKTMLICYNDDYFERLWCTFELGARAASGGDMVLLPLLRAPAVLAITVFMTLAHTFEYCGDYYLHNHVFPWQSLPPPPPATPFFRMPWQQPAAAATTALEGYDHNLITGILSFAFNFVPVWIFVAVTGIATEQKLHFMDQLKGFSVAKTKCFAPSDRPIVEGAIANWFRKDRSESDADAIGRFEHEVRDGRVAEQLYEAAGRQAGLLRPYDLWMAFLVPWWMTAADLGSMAPCGWDETNALYLATAPYVGFVTGAMLTAKLTEKFVTLVCYGTEHWLPARLFLSFLAVVFYFMASGIGNVLISVAFLYATEGRFL